MVLRGSQVGLGSPIAIAVCILTHCFELRHNSHAMVEPEQVVCLCLARFTI